jgi:hypothetical protein
MDQSTSTTATIQLEPTDALVQVIRSIREHGPHAQSSYPATSTWASVLRRCADLMAPYDATIDLMHPKTPARRARMQALARETSLCVESRESLTGGDQFPGLRLRNTGEMDNGPPPTMASPAYRQKLKESLRTIQKPFLDPYLDTLPLRVESQKLATLSGLLTFSAIDRQDDDQFATIKSTEMLVDTGAQISLITDDILPQPFRDYLTDSIHDAYRSADGISVQVDASFSFTDRKIHMACVFQVVPRSRIPNHRVGIILGQNSCLDHMVYTLTPRLFIRAALGEDEIWGDMAIHQYVDPGGNIVHLS